MKKEEISHSFQPAWARDAAHQHAASDWRRTSARPSYSAAPQAASVTQPDAATRLRTVLMSDAYTQMPTIDALRVDLADGAYATVVDGTLRIYGFPRNVGGLRDSPSNSKRLDGVKGGDESLVVEKFGSENRYRSSEKLIGGGGKEGERGKEAPKAPEVDGISVTLPESHAESLGSDFGNPPPKGANDQPHLLLELPLYLSESNEISSAKIVCDNAPESLAGLIVALKGLGIKEERLTRLAATLLKILGQDPSGSKQRGDGKVPPGTPSKP